MRPVWPTAWGLDEVQKELASKAREESTQKMQQIYRNRPTGKNRSFSVGWAEAVVGRAELDSKTAEEQE